MTLIEEVKDDKINKVVIAYITGFFDGEGCVQLKKDTRNNIQFSISLSNTNLDILKRIKSVFRGEVYIKSEGCENHKKQWVWEIKNRVDIKFFLKTILPYSTVKLSQIKLGLEYLERTTKGTPYKRLPSGEQKLRESYIEKFREPKHYHYSIEEVKRFDNLIKTTKQTYEDVEDHVYSYISGFFDAEGLIGAYRNSNRDDINLRITLANTYLPILIGLKATFGGNVILHKKPEEHLEWRQRWDWKIDNKNDQLFFLNKIIPYSIVKRQQLELGLKWFELTKNHSNDRIPFEEQQTRQLIADKLKEMKNEEYTNEEIKDLNELIEDMNIDKHQKTMMDF